MKKLLLIFVGLLAAAGLLLGISEAAVADSPLSGSITAVYNSSSGELETSGSYVWDKCDDKNKDKIVGYAIFVNNGTPATNDVNALDGSGMHLINSGNPCDTNPGSWSDSHTLTQAPTNVCVVFYDVKNDKVGKTGEHSNTGAGTGYNTDNSWDHNHKVFPDGTCTQPTALTTGSVTICHATASDANPYVEESPNIKNDGSLTGGHLNHTGSVWFSGISVSWGDIIPPYVSGNFNYPGLNWDTNGQAFWNNECEEPSANPSVTPSVTPTPTNTPSNGGGSNDGGDGLGCATHDCSTHPSSSSQPIQAVLGASTMAGTGTFENTVMDFMLVAGIVVLALGAKKYAKESK